MQDNFLKNKKIGLISLLVIVIIVSICIYNFSGFKKLNKNDNESIFVDDQNTVEISSKDMDTNDKEAVKTTADSTEKLKDKTIIVEIKGEVNSPNVYTLDENAIIKDLIDLAGGVTENADLTNINRAKKLQNHELIYIGNKNDEKESQNSSQSIAQSVDNSNKMVDINTATTEVLKTLNGIGDSKAKSIIDYREQNGEFKNIEELKNVTGIGEKMFEKIKDCIIV